MTRVGGPKPQGGRAWRSAARADDEGLGVALAALGTRIATLRKAGGLTQEALATKANLDVRHVQDVEYGRTNLTFATMRAIAKGLNTSVAELMQGVA